MPYSLLTQASHPRRRRPAAKGGSTPAAVRGSLTRTIQTARGLAAAAERVRRRRLKLRRAHRVRQARPVRRGHLVRERLTQRQRPNLRVS